MQGKVEWYSDTRGFGILSVIASDGASNKYYFHVTKVAKSPIKIKHGQRAEFDVNPTPPRPNNLPTAMNIIISEPVAAPVAPNGGVQ